MFRRLALFLPLKRYKILGGYIMNRLRVLWGLMFLLVLAASTQTFASNPDTWEYQCCKGKYIHPSKVPFPAINTTLSIEWGAGYTRGFIFNDIKNEAKYVVKNGIKYYGWCLDEKIQYDLTLSEYSVKLYSPAMIKAKDYFDKVVPWDKILYIINHRDGYGWREVQEAVYHYVDGVVLEDRVTGDDDLIADAEANGEGYVPPPGGKTILIAYVTAIADGVVNKKCEESQPYIIEIPLPECKGTKTIGYWKNHLDAWPVDSLVLGTQTYNKSELVRLLRKSPRGDASIILAKQLIAAKLNILAGANADDIGSVIDDADTLLASYAGKLPYRVRASSPAGQDMIDLAEQLEEYNRDYKGCKVKEKKTCGCKKIYNMTMKYLGDTTATTVKAYDKHGNLVGEFTLNSDGTFFVDTVVKPEMTFVIGDDCITIHTSCSKPIGPGMVFGNLKIIDWTAELKSCKKTPQTQKT
jgi:hypothetical protein